METVPPTLPEPTVEYEVQYSFISSGLRRVEFDTHGLGLLLDFQSMETPSEALQLGIATPDAERMLHALQSMVAQLQRALQERPASGPAH